MNRYEDLKEMIENKQYLEDFINERQEVQEFEKECSDIASKANSLAQENIKLFEKV